jgi:hypothetical protein
MWSCNPTHTYTPQPSHAVQGHQSSYFTVLQTDSIYITTKFTDNKSNKQGSISALIAESMTLTTLFHLYDYITSN